MNSVCAVVSVRSAVLVSNEARYISVSLPQNFHPQPKQVECGFGGKQPKQKLAEQTKKASSETYKCACSGAFFSMFSSYSPRFGTSRMVVVVVKVVVVVVVVRVMVVMVIVMMVVV